jgi:hypothetical protein
MKNTDIVIAHYNENLDWVSELDLTYINKIWIYSKSPLPNNYISLPNIGRESHTYLHHIISRYPNFPENIIFLQGNPFGHHESIKPNNVENINFWLKYIQSKECTPNGHYNDYDRFLVNGKLSNWNNQHLNVTNYSIHEWIQKYLSTNEKSGNIYWSAQFGIKSLKILNHPLNFYQILLNQHTYLHPEVSHFLERTWGIIFKI